MLSSSGSQKYYIGRTRSFENTRAVSLRATGLNPVPLWYGEDSTTTWLSDRVGRRSRRANLADPLTERNCIGGRLETTTCGAAQGRCPRFTGADPEGLDECPVECAGVLKSPAARQAG